MWNMSVECVWNMSMWNVCVELREECVCGIFLCGICVWNRWLNICV